MLVVEDMRKITTISEIVATITVIPTRKRDHCSCDWLGIFLVEYSKVQGSKLPVFQTSEAERLSSKF